MTTITQWRWGSACSASSSTRVGSGGGSGGVVGPGGGSGGVGVVATNGVGGGGGGGFHIVPRRLYRRLHRERPTFTDPMAKVLYVIRMGWHRWGREARRRWALNLIVECNATANAAREWLAADARAHESDARFPRSLP